MIGIIKCEGGTKSSDLIIVRSFVKRSPFYIILLTDQLKAQILVL